MRLEIYLCLIGVIFAMAGISTIAPRCCALKFVESGIIINFEEPKHKEEYSDEPELNGTYRLISPDQVYNDDLPVECRKGFKVVSIQDHALDILATPVSTRRMETWMTNFASRQLIPVLRIPFHSARFNINKYFLFN